MGYISKSIASIDEPQTVSLSVVPNFVQFRSRPAERVPLELVVRIFMTPDTADLATVSELRIVDTAGGVHTFRGTTDIVAVDGTTFYVSADPSDTAENLRRVLAADQWIGPRFDLTVPFNWTAAGVPENGSVLHIVSRGAGAEYNMTVAAPNDPDETAYGIWWGAETSTNGDSISGDAASVGIALDVYADPDVRLGQDDRPDTPARIGSYVTTLRKTYMGAPLWFELNALFSRYRAYNRPDGAFGWFDPGTARMFRFAARVVAANSYYFYQSNALCVLSGHGPIREDIDMKPYVFDGRPCKLLTDKPRTTYVRGQRAFLNFIFADDQDGEPYTLLVSYRAYATGGTYLGTAYGQPRNRAEFSTVNTCELNIDALLDQFPEAGMVRVGLAIAPAGATEGRALVSDELEFEVLPECLHRLCQFLFLNRLGGWDSFNFDGDVQNEIKPDAETYARTITPAYTFGDPVEEVYDVQLSDVYTVEGAPVTDEVAAWLKSLAASPVVLDGAGRYVIVEDFTLQTSAATRNMQRPTIKYRLSE